MGEIPNLKKGICSAAGVPIENFWLSNDIASGTVSVW